ncbi:MAG TPA: NAD(P)H-hydrate dehydratase [Kiritimatiellia bacterium]|nr:NAD(P)H-hydrate dehydratase [Kiritimatiellia bacterium]HRZ11192.1 NAD(P)H-hydrate dehydratase [Kiritimatiellia bacterium]HSA19043.1 NAD(P)H-hydrate dehydratase [Kiritimatiellia bacterium]
MKIVTAEQMRELDRRTIEEAETPGEVLMERAGQGVADAVARLAETAGFHHPLVHLIAGRGNNGGDAFAAARFLKEDGFAVQVWIAGAANEIQGDALRHFSRMKDAKITARELPTREDWEESLAYPAAGDLLVDGVLGTGGSGPARGPAAGAIEYINQQSRQALVVAIDLPSGLNADTGAAEGAAVRADLTVTMGLPKRGLLEPAALEYVGALEVVDIGIPAEYITQAALAEDREFIHPNDLRPLLPRRPRATHKGSQGHVLLIGGARGYAGAIAMAARAALRSGVGLVTVLTPAGVAPIVAGSVLEAMVQGGPETDTGSLSAAFWADWRNRIDKFGAVLIGPGLTRNPEGTAIMRHLIRECPPPLVMDADALSLLEGQPHFIAKCRRTALITPHPGELARLMAQDIETIQQDRHAAARAAAESTGAVVVLKGAGTLVAETGKPVQMNLTGNPGMATGGTGDVLAGLAAGLLAQGLTPYDAARLAVYLHGRAGDTAALHKSQAGLTALDVLDELPYAFREISIR